MIDTHYHFYEAIAMDPDDLHATDKAMDGVVETRHRKTHLRNHPATLDSSSPAGCHLLALPAELLLMIYELVVSEPGSILIDPVGNT